MRRGPLSRSQNCRFVSAVLSVSVVAATFAECVQNTIFGTISMGEGN